MIWSDIAFTEGIGLTVIENVWVTPLQLLENGVTVIKVVIGTFETLVAEKAAISPVPDKGTKPTSEFVFTQLYFVLINAEPEKITGVVVLLVHNFWSLIVFTKGTGLTVIEKVWLDPLQVFDTGVTCIKEVMGTLEAFVAVKEAIFPVPDKGMRPVPELVLVHL